MIFSSYAFAMGQSGGAGVQSVNPIAVLAPLILLITSIIVICFIFFNKKSESNHSNNSENHGTIQSNREPFVRTYTGNQETAQKKFLTDAEILAIKGYYPISENWEQGTWGCSAFLVALFLCFFIIGVLIFIYMLIVKPAGKLIVTYGYRDPDKICPRCAETIKQAANVCRYCGYEFYNSSDSETK